jgi:hypothetical protein
MSAQVRTRKAKNRSTSNNKKTLKPLTNHLYTLVAAFVGVALGVAGSAGFLSSTIHSQMMADTATLRSQLLSIRPAAASYTSATTGTSLNNACVVPSSVTTPTSVPSITTASITSTTPTSSTTPQTPAAPTYTFVHKLVSGVFNKEEATLSNTGPESTNNVSFTNTVNTEVTNTNTLNIENNNAQSSESGSSSSKANTGSGQVTSGSSNNSSSTDFNVSVSN